RTPTSGKRPPHPPGCAREHPRSAERGECCTRGFTRRAPPRGSRGASVCLLSQQHSGQQQQPKPRSRRHEQSPCPEGLAGLDPQKGERTSTTFLPRFLRIVPAGVRDRNKPLRPPARRSGGKRMKRADCSGQGEGLEVRQRRCGPLPESERLAVQ